MTSASKHKEQNPASTGKGATLRGRMAGIRRELDGLRMHNGSADLFAATLAELDALGDEIADATDAMMTACEGIQDTADAIAAKTKERGTKMKLKKIAQQTGDIFEACSFQDLTGQRIAKITRTVTAIGETVDGVSALAGGKGAKKSNRRDKNRGINRIDGGITLEGPQINGPAVSQAAIDSMFD